jgi:predicted acyltransferase
MESRLPKSPSKSAAPATSPVPSLPNPQTAPSTRLMSLDALRGFDMFWIIGGESLLQAIANLTGSPTFRTLAYRHTEHPEWNGFTFYDLIFPTFMFIAGVAVPYSFAAHWSRGESSAQLHFRIIRRGIVLVLLGLVINGILNFDFTLHFTEDASGHRQLVHDFSHVRFPSVLGRIGLAYLFAALIALRTRPRNQLLTGIGLLLGYWAALQFIPVPGFETGSLFPGETVGDFIDRHALPGRLYKIVRDPEGLFSTIPAIATVLFGVMAGHWLRRSDRVGTVKAGGLAIAGGVFLALAYLWNTTFPINKNLWTSSFVLWTSGCSLLLLSVFYLVIDVWKIRGWAFFFMVIGANAITIYVGQHIIDFDALAKIAFSDHMHAILRASGGLFLKWLFLFFLYRQRIFLRV